MLLINIVEMNGQLFYMNDVPEEKKKYIKDNLTKIDPRYGEINDLPTGQLDQVKHLLSEQAARALNYRKIDKTA